MRNPTPNTPNVSADELAKLAAPHEQRLGRKLTMDEILQLQTYGTLLPRAAVSQGGITEPTRANLQGLMAAPVEPLEAMAYVDRLSSGGRKIATATGKVNPCPVDLLASVLDVVVKHGIRYTLPGAPRDPTIMRTVRFLCAEMSGPIVVDAPLDSINGQYRRITFMGCGCVTLQSHEGTWLITQRDSVTLT